MRILAMGVGALLLFPLPAAAQSSATVAPGDTVRVLTVADRARICANPGCPSDEALARIHTDSSVAVQDTLTEEGGAVCVRWFKVTYQAWTGWISEFDTNAAPGDPLERECPISSGGAG